MVKMVKMGKYKNENLVKNGKNENYVKFGVLIVKKWRI